MDLPIPPCDPQMAEFLLGLKTQMKNFTELVTALDKSRAENETLRARIQELELLMQKSKKPISEAPRAPRREPTPVLSSTQNTVNGSAASKHAPQPSVPDPTDVTPSEPVWTTVVKSNVPRKQKAPLSDRKRLATCRPFTAPRTMSDTENGYEYIYMHRSRAVDRKEIRQRFAILGITTSRILDITFPAHSVMGLLVHKEFIPALRTIIIDECELSLIDDFDPLLLPILSIPSTMI